MPCVIDQVVGSVTSVTKAGIAVSRRVKSMRTICSHIKKPTRINAGAVAAAGTITAKGASRIASRKNTPTKTAHQGDYRTEQNSQDNCPAHMERQQHRHDEQSPGGDGGVGLRQAAECHRWVGIAVSRRHDKARVDRPDEGDEQTDAGANR